MGEREGQGTAFVECTLVLRHGIKGVVAVRARPRSRPVLALLSDWRNSYPLPKPSTLACTHPPRSAPGSPVRTPPHHAQNPTPTPGSPKSAPPAAFPRARNASAVSAATSTPPPDRSDAASCDSPVLHFVPTKHAAADTRSAASTAPTPPTACATAHRSVLSGSNNSLPPSPSARNPGAGSLRTCSAASPRPPAGLRAPSVFCNHRLQHLFVQTQIHHQLLESRVLVAQLLCLLRLTHIHAAVLRFPGVDRMLRHARFTRHILCPAPCLQLLQ